MNEFWTGENDLHRDDVNLRDISLAPSPVRAYHTRPRCGVPLPVVVHAAHPLLSGLAPGFRFDVYGCGPVFRPVPTATLLASKDPLLPPGEHSVPGVAEPLRMPVVLASSRGLGRVFAVNTLPQAEVASHLTARWPST